MCLTTINNKYLILTMNEKIKIRACFLVQSTSPRMDCGSRYELEVSLLDARRREVLRCSRERSEPQWSNAHWKQVSGSCFVLFVRFKKSCMARYVSYINIRKRFHKCDIILIRFTFGIVH